MNQMPTFNAVLQASALFKRLELPLRHSSQAENWLKCSRHFVQSLAWFPCFIQAERILRLRWTHLWIG